MGTAESKGARRYRSNKHFRYKNETPIVHQCQHKNKQSETLIVGHKNSMKRKNETIGRLFFPRRSFAKLIFSRLVPLLISSPLNPSVEGSVLNHSFPLQRAHSEIQIISSELSHHQRIG